MTPDELKAARSERLNKLYQQMDKERVKAKAIAAVWVAIQDLPLDLKMDVLDAVHDHIAPVYEEKHPEAFMGDEDAS